MVNGYRWRRTNLMAANGRPVENDYCLEDAAGRAVARIYLVNGGPQGGRWLWEFQVDERGRPWRAGGGFCDTGPEAKLACEELAAKVVVDGESTN